MPSLPYVLRDEDMKELSHLFDINKTFQKSSAHDERGFSLMTSVNTTSRKLPFDQSLNYRGPTSSMVIMETVVSAYPKKKSEKYSISYVHTFIYGIKIIIRSIPADVHMQTPINSY
ncbi:hypothetical protein RF11_14113 [Thelohanellus kitauei]|uniref:Uncharacterized protein n=1 Tax=Thelohanellus kitauei TaxID=669202 RepID=A0A0C2MYY9_THEKT|nr:hypothetical protein RF11_14113 [Thelohanellus kitauei]